MSKRKRPPVIDVLGKMRDTTIERMTDVNLDQLHDYSLLVLWGAMRELERRGKPQSVAVRCLRKLRTDSWPE